MVIDTIAYCVGILSLAAAVFVLSREVARLRREITSMHIDLTMVSNAVDVLFEKTSVLNSERYGRLADALLGLSARVRELRSLLLPERSVSFRLRLIRNRLKCYGRLSK